VGVAAVEGVEVRGPAEGRFGEILTPDALRFVGELQREFGATRNRLLDRRRERQAQLDAGELPDFLPETRGIRDGDWTIAPVPDDLQDRRVEITGPTDRKMVINALNSGARMFMADFEDSLSPTWRNVVQGQVNLVDAIERTIEFQDPDGKAYRLNEEVATLLVRPRGWHLPERHVLVDGEPVSASLFDFGLYFFHNPRRLLERRTGPYFYLPKLESHLEARLWNDVFEFAQDALDVPRGTIKATVLIETILAAFEMDEILFELRDHSAGLNAGRWDYMFSVIKKFRDRPEFVLPDRNQVTMSVPFMRAYTELLVKTCHRRAAHAMGGMAAFVPSRKDPSINEVAIAKVREDKIREANDGFDGTWVAHPDLVGVATEEFDEVLRAEANQVERLRDDVSVSAADLLDVAATPGDVTEEGLRNDVSVGIQYLANWLTGNGAAAIFNLMEDAATCEIARSQVWQWIRHGTQLKEGATATRELVRRIEDEELEKIRAAAGEEVYARSRPDEARELFERVALGEEFVEFLTLPAYEYID
jgi:malate synthase